MIVDKLKKQFRESSDLIVKNINNVTIIFLESLCDSNKLNEFIFKNLRTKKFYNLRDMITAPNVVYVDSYDKLEFYLNNGFAVVMDKKDIIVCEVKGNLYRTITMPTTEPSINGPKDSFNESILTNLGLIKRRIKSDKLVNEDMFIGRKTLTKVSVLYLDDIADKSIVSEITNKLSDIDIDGIIDIEVLMQKLDDRKFPMPTIMKSERPDKVANSLLEGKIVIIADNSCYALILPVFFSDFVNPESDNYVKSTNINILKVIRFMCLLITITLPALYISIINYNPQSIPLNLLLSFQSGRSGVPFPSSFEAIFMIFLCAILRESDIRFPSNYGSSISILGALILGEAAVSASIASPIMIIIIGITFITGLVFSSGEVISGLRIYRLFLLVCSIVFGLYGFVLGSILLLLHLANIENYNRPYLYPVAPFDKNYFFKTLLKKDNIKFRSKELTNNLRKEK